MKKEIDFSRGVRNKFAGQRLKIVGDPKSPPPKLGDRHYVVTLPGGIELDVFASNKSTARQAAQDYFGQRRLPKGTTVAPAANPAMESAQVTAIGEAAIIVLPKKVLHKLKVQTGDPLYFVETLNGVELTSESTMLKALKKLA